jgi:hypothetical protein
MKEGRAATTAGAPSTSAANDVVSQMMKRVMKDIMARGEASDDKAAKKKRSKKVRREGIRQSAYLGA